MKDMGSEGIESPSAAYGSGPTTEDHNESSKGNNVAKGFVWFIMGFLTFLFGIPFLAVYGLGILMIIGGCIIMVVGVIMCFT